MLKNVYFLGKNVKIVLAGKLFKSAPPPDSRFVTPAYYYNFVEFVCIAKCTLLFKQEPSNSSICSAFASSALLHLFFNSNSVSFVEGERKNISCPRAQGTLATPLFKVRVKGVLNPNFRPFNFELNKKIFLN